MKRILALSLLLVASLGITGCHGLTPNEAERLGKLHDVATDPGATADEAEEATQELLDEIGLLLERHERRAAVADTLMSTVTATLNGFLLQALAAATSAIETRVSNST